MDLTFAESIIVALKGRKLPPGRPSMTRRDRALRDTTILFARKRSAKLRSEGTRPSEADEIAAQEASAVAGQYGDTVAWTTILQEMKRSNKKGGG